jgi:RimJ/RimL family protein N-acetyltransferase
MARDDLDAMMAWRPFADPLYQAFDFPRRSKVETVRWFEWRSRDPSRRLYTVEDEEGRVIGSLTLREINGTQSARLGITLGADFVSQGYGTEALSLFLDYYFETLGFEEMVLDVAATNLRAVRTYQALGFRYVSQHYRLASDASFEVLRRDPRYKHLQRFFQRRGNLHEVLFYDFALSRDEWRARAGGEPGRAGDSSPRGNRRA